MELPGELRVRFGRVRRLASGMVLQGGVELSDLFSLWIRGHGEGGGE